MNDWLNLARRGVFLCFLAIVATVETGHAQIADSEEARPDYVGSPACGTCHADEMAAWQGSHHAWAWRLPTVESVLGDFDGAVFNHKGIATRFFERDGEFFVEADGSNGKPAEFRVIGTAGVAPLQQYLVETDPGRIQALDIAWDDLEKRWYHLYPDQDLPHTDGLHWSGPYKNWNARCAECHATGYQKDYDPLTKTYHSTQAEIGIGCETCHGPGEAHVAWAQSPANTRAPDWVDIDDQGLTINFDRDHAQIEIEQCAGCHSRREPLAASSPLPGTPFADNYRLALLRDGLYHADGQILDEVYVYGSFLQSRMNAMGVRCTNCHQPHSGNLKADGNGVCTQCHSPTGNAAFPTIEAKTYDARAHHHHEPDTAGTQCTSCHMPERMYMVIDGRRDHSFRVPRPDLSVKVGTPNACTDCHTDQSPAWAAEWVVKWFPDGRSGTPHYGEIIASAWAGLDEKSEKSLLALADDHDLPDIVRATAIDMLRATRSPEVIDQVARYLSGSSPLVQSAAVGVQRLLPPRPRAERLIVLLEHPMRSVRVDVARALIGLSPEQLPPDIAAAVGAAMREYQGTLAAKSDFPEVQLAIGGTALVFRNLPAAERAFREAVSMDPQLPDAWMMLARLNMARRDLGAAAAALTEGIAANPGSGDLHHSLGNVRITAGNDQQAIGPLSEAVRLMPENGAAKADLGVLLSRLNRHDEAIPLLERAQASGAGSPIVLFQLISSEVATGDRDAAERNALKLELLYPGSPQATEARRLLQ